jgi:hypothetical protein
VPALLVLVFVLAVASCGVDGGRTEGLAAGDRKVGDAAPPTDAETSTTTQETDDPGEPPGDEPTDDEPTDDGSNDEGLDADRYGDDASLDGLHDACLAGDDRACDLLYLTSPVDSEYESVGEGCGGRAPTDEFCAPETEMSDDGFSSLDNPGLDVLSRDCVAGDPIACDLLYQISPIDSEEEQLAHTCGGAVPGGAYPDCRTRMVWRAATGQAVVSTSDGKTLATFAVR